MRKVAIAGAETCSYQELSATLEALTQNIRTEGLELICPQEAILPVTKYSNMNRTAVTYVLCDEENVLTDADCIVVFWDGNNRLSEKVAELAKVKGKQLRIHRTKDIVAAAPKRSITSILTGNRE